MQPGTPAMALGAQSEDDLQLRKLVQKLQRLYSSWPLLLFKTYIFVALHGEACGAVSVGCQRAAKAGCQHRRRGMVGRRARGHSRGGAAQGAADV